MHEQSNRNAALPDAPGDRDAFERSLLPVTRLSGLVGAALVLVLFPLWSLFDAVLEPALAPRLFQLRWIFMLPIAIAAICVWRGGTRPRPLYLAVFALLTLPALAIAWMIPRVEHLEAYLIGYSLLISAAGALIVLPLRWTVAVLIALLALVVALSWQHPRPAQEMAIIAFFLGTVTVVNSAVAWLMWHVRLTQFRTMGELETRRRETNDLLDQVVRLSNEDDLTGLANRRRFRRELDEVVQIDLPLQAAIIDMDHFKEINDRHGHHVGDAVLVAVAQLLRLEFSDSGTAARLGGDEFGVLLQGEDLASRLVRVQQKVAAGLTADLNGIEAGLSAGIATHTPGESAHDLLRRADQALYRSKNKGSGVCVDGID